MSEPRHLRPVPPARSTDPPPHDLALEEALLGDLWREPDVRLPAVADLVDLADFYSEAHAHVFAALLTLSADGNGLIDLDTVARHLTRQGLLEAAGGRDRLQQIHMAGNGAWRRNATEVARLAASRRWVNIAAEIDRAARDGLDPTGIVDRADQLRTAPTVRLLSTGELVALPPPEWLVDGLVPAAALVLLYGPSTAGKSFVAIDLAAHVATGRRWHSHDVRPGRVLYVAGEGVAGVARRINAWCDRYSTDPATLDVDWLPQAINLTDDHACADLARRAAASGTTLVIVDTLARCTPGVDENSGRDVGHVIANCERIRETGATVVLVHHSGKDLDKGARGHSSLKAATDAELELSIAGKGLAGLKNTKQKDAAAAEPMLLRITPHLDSAVLDLEDVATGEAVDWEGPTEAAAAVVAFLAAFGKPLSGTALVKEMRNAGHRFREQTIRAAADLAVQNGRLNCRPGPRNAKVYEPVGAPVQEDLVGF